MRTVNIIQKIATVMCQPLGFSNIIFVYKIIRKKE